MLPPRVNAAGDIGMAVRCEPARDLVDGVLRPDTGGTLTGGFGDHRKASGAPPDVCCVGGMKKGEVKT